MAKVTNPLMSISASGTVGKIAAFRTTKGGFVCALKPKSYAQNSIAMLINQQRMSDARTSFKTLSDQDRGLWQQVATYRNYNLWPAFFAEYNYQMIVYPNMPLIPDPRVRGTPAPGPLIGTQWDSGATTWDGGTTIFDA